MNLDEIGPKIQQLRKSLKITQQELSDLSGISRVTLGKLERGEIAPISLKTLDLILNKLNYEIDFVVKNKFSLPTLDQMGQDSKFYT
ncbi:MAG: transcriptional regulator [Gammaproteobacteria bacterium]|nr:MAG: transcriptional regulator [Gammaproteobacteria bacterium]